MKILLIQPSDKKSYGKMKGLVHAYPPTNLLCLSGMIKKHRNDEIKLIDFQLINKPLKELKILREKWDIVAITSMTQTFSNALNIAGFIKKQNQKTKIIFGGAHISSIPNELKHSVIDYVVIGEGEKTIVELLDALEKNSDLAKIKGIGYKIKNRLKFTEPRPLIENLDELPLWDYGLVNLNDYSHPIQKRKPFALIFTSRGCPYGCTYCCKAVFGRKVRYRSPKHIVDEIEFLMNEQGVKELHFGDDAMNIRKEFMIDICKEILKRKLHIYWKCGLRADNCDIELLNIMKKAGCYSVGIGVESGNQKILESIKKNLKLEEVKKAVKLAKKAGIETVCYFILGFPKDTKKTMNDTINFARNLKCDIAKFGILTPVPGSELYSKLEKEKKLMKKWSDYKFHDKPVYKLDYLEPEDVLKAYKKAYRSVYFTPSFIIKSLKKIGNPLELKRYINTGFIMLKMLLKKD